MAIPKPKTLKGRIRYWLVVCLLAISRLITKLLRGKKMTIPAERVDIIIPKGAKFYLEFQQVQDNLEPISLAGKTLKCTIKESHSSPVILHELTEANEGMVKVDEANGIFAMQIPSDKTDIPQDFGVYDIILIDNNYPTVETERVLQGSVTYSKGVTKQWP